MFIAIYEEFCNTGKTLKEAFDQLQDICDAQSMEECKFFEGELIEVETKIEKKVIPVAKKVINKGSK